jgi:hypothetical protein
MRSLARAYSGGEIVRAESHETKGADEMNKNLARLATLAVMMAVPVGVFAQSATTSQPAAQASSTQATNTDAAKKSEGTKKSSHKKHKKSTKKSTKKTTTTTTTTTDAAKKDGSKAPEKN